MRGSLLDISRPCRELRQDHDHHDLSIAKTCMTYSLPKFILVGFLSKGTTDIKIGIAYFFGFVVYQHLCELLRFEIRKVRLKKSSGKESPAFFSDYTICI